MIRLSGTDPEQSFGDRVRLSRERMRTPKGERWTQNDLAKALGVKRNTVSRWENDGFLPKDPVVIATLSRVLHVSTDWLLAGLGEPDIPTHKAKGVSDRPMQPYGHGRLDSAESLPAPAADIVLRYLGRLTAAGCSMQQAHEAERFLVAGARNGLVKKPFEQREIKDVIGDIDAAWDFVIHVLRRQGIRA